jgi:hypothetical protein
MSKYFSLAEKEALKKMALVFLYAGGSAVIPGILAYISEKPELMLLGIVVNVIWAGFAKYMKVKKLADNS